MWHRSELCSDESANLNMVYNKLKFKVCLGASKFKLKGRLFFPSWELFFCGSATQAALAGT